MAATLKANREYREGARALPDRTDDRIEKTCTHVEDQGKQLLSCSAHAAVGLLEYFLHKDVGVVFDLSRLFLYQQALMMNGQGLGNRGVSLRTVMKAVRNSGVLPEPEYFAYDFRNLLRKPEEAQLREAKRYRGGCYFRFDEPGESPTGATILRRMKRFLHGGYPCVFGFEMFETMPSQDSKGDPMIPFPAQEAQSIDNHSVMAVGYDDDLVIVNPEDGGKTRGALRIRNSWGKNWGEGGYGWLPYEYVKEDRSFDFWSLTSAMFEGSVLYKA